MSKCVNENCKNDPMSSINQILATGDGDFACCPECLKEFHKQRDKFFNNIHDNEWYYDWMHNF